jgi:hydroxymethylbilane synthase
LSSQIIVGTRGSPLALAQTQIVIGLLRKKHESQFDFQIKKILTEGDELSRKPGSNYTGKDSFTRTIDLALVAGKIDFAVHSLKDLPIENFDSDEIEVTSFPKRESPFDVLIPCKDKDTLRTLPKGAAIGTSSIRRAEQLRQFRSDFQIVEIHGNVQTRIEKLRTNSNLQAIVLARAGLSRLGLEKLGWEIPGRIMLPAAGQGALAIVTRKDDSQTKALVSKIDDKTTRVCVSAEIAFSRELGGGCNLPVAALARISKSTPRKLVLEGLIVDSAGMRRSKISGSPSKADYLGKKLASKLKIK